MRQETWQRQGGGKRRAQESARHTQGSVSHNRGALRGHGQQSISQMETLCTNLPQASLTRPRGPEARPGDTAAPTAAARSGQGRGEGNQGACLVVTLSTMIT